MELKRKHAELLSRSTTGNDHGMKEKRYDYAPIISRMEKDDQQIPGMPGISGIVPGWGQGGQAIQSAAVSDAREEADTDGNNINAINRASKRTRMTPSPTPPGGNIPFPANSNWWRKSSSDYARELMSSITTTTASGIPATTTADHPALATAAVAAAIPLPPDIEDSLCGPSTGASLASTVNTSGGSTFESGEHQKDDDSSSLLHLLGEVAEATEVVDGRDDSYKSFATATAAQDDDSFILSHQQFDPRDRERMELRELQRQQAQLARHHAEEDALALAQLETEQKERELRELQLQRQQLMQSHAAAVAAASGTPEELRHLQRQREQLAHHQARAAVAAAGAARYSSAAARSASMGGLGGVDPLAFSSSSSSSQLQQQQQELQNQLQQQELNQIFPTPLHAQHHQRRQQELAARRRLGLQQNPMLGQYLGGGGGGAVAAVSGRGGLGGYYGVQPTTRQQMQAQMQAQMRMEMELELDMQRQRQMLVESSAATRPDAEAIANAAADVDADEAAVAAVAASYSADKVPSASIEKELEESFQQDASFDESDDEDEEEDDAIVVGKSDNRDHLAMLTGAAGAGAPAASAPAATARTAAGNISKTQLSSHPNSSSVSNSKTKRTVGTKITDNSQGSSISSMGSGVTIDTDGKEVKFREYQAVSWTKKYEELLKFREDNGHCFVPNCYPENPGLAQWTKRQRYQYKLKKDGKRSTITDERVDALDEAGFIWDSHKAVWWERYQELKEFRKSHGHCNVPSRYQANIQLAIWVKRQRRQWKYKMDNQDNCMTDDRQQALESIGFVWDMTKIKKSK